MKYKTIYILLLILLNLNCRTSQSFNRNPKIEIIQEFEIGKTYNYTIQKSNEEPKSANQHLNLPVLNVSLEITSVVDSSKICSFNYGNLVIPQTNTETYSKDLVTIFNGISLKFMLNSKGIFKELTNYEEAKKGFEDMLLKKGMLTTVDFDEVTYKKTIEAIKFTYETPDLLIYSHFEELPILFSLFGELIDVDSINIDSVMMPEGITNDHQTGLKFTKISEISNPNIKITQKIIFPKETLSEFINNALDKLPKRVDKLNEIESLEEGGVTILTNYYYNYVDKIMSKIESTKTVIYNEHKNQKTTIITLVK